MLQYARAWRVPDSARDKVTLTAGTDLAHAQRNFERLPPLNPVGTLDGRYVLFSLPIGRPDVLADQSQPLHLLRKRL